MVEMASPVRAKEFLAMCILLFTPCHTTQAKAIQPARKQ